MGVDTGSKIKLTYREYVQFPADGRRHEIIDGDHYVNPAPETNHQRVSRRMQLQLMLQIEETGRGEVFDAPTDLQLSLSDVVQPDLIIILQRNRTIVTPTKIKGVPDLVVEITSPSSEKSDRELKKELYRRSGVPEYWVVDPTEHVVEQYVLEGGSYALVATENERVEFRQLPGVAVDLARVW